MTSINTTIKTAASLDQEGQYHAADRLDRALALRTSTAGIGGITSAFFKLLQNVAPKLLKMAPAILKSLENEFIKKAVTKEGKQAAINKLTQLSLSGIKSLASDPSARTKGLAALGVAGVAGGIGYAEMHKGRPGADTTTDTTQGTTITDTTPGGAPGGAAVPAAGGAAVPAPGGAPGGSTIGWMGYGAAMLDQLGYEGTTNQLQHDMEASKVPQGYIDIMMRAWHMHYDGQLSVQKEMGKIPGAGNLELYPPHNPLRQARPVIPPAGAPPLARALTPALGTAAVSAPGTAGAQGSSVGAQPKILP